MRELAIAFHALTCTCGPLDRQLEALAALDGVAQRLFRGVADVVAMQHENHHGTASSHAGCQRLGALVAETGQ